MDLAKTLTTTFNVLILLGATINAQQEKQIQPAPTGLVLEITYYKDAPPSYLSVPGDSGKVSGGWYARFGRLPGWQLPVGHLPVRAVNIASRPGGDSVMIRVSVFRGVRFHDQENLAGIYNMRENETVSINDLARFGVEPFRVRVVRITPAIPSQPIVKSRAKSLEIVSIESLNSTLPAYRLTLHNLSHKNISAFSIEVLNAGKMELSSMPQGKDGLPLIPAGGFYESNEPLLTRAQPAAGDFAPSAPTLQETVISAVIFEDGSYEGDVERAAEFRAFILGRKLALTRLLAIFVAGVETFSDDQERAEQVKWFRDRVLALSDEVDEHALVRLQEDFPNLNQKKKADLRTSAEVALQSIRKDLLNDLDALEKGQPSDPADFRPWLIEVGDRYRSWLSRL